LLEDYGFGEGGLDVGAGTVGESKARGGVDQACPLADETSRLGDVFGVACRTDYPAEGSSVIAGGGKAGGEGFDQGNGHHLVEGRQGEDVGGLVERGEAVAVNGFKEDYGVAEEGLAEGDQLRGFGLAATGDDEDGVGGELSPELCELLDEIVATLVVPLESGDAEDDERSGWKAEGCSSGCFGGDIGGRAEALDVDEVGNTEAELPRGAMGFVIVPVAGGQVLQVRELVKVCVGLFRAVSKDDAGPGEAKAVEAIHPGGDVGILHVENVAGGADGSPQGE